MTLERLAHFWPHIAAAVHVILALMVSVHVVLHKRNTSAAVGWVGVAWLSPIVGSLMYLVFGINRIKRRGMTIRADRAHRKSPSAVEPCTPEALATALGPDHGYLLSLSAVVDRVSPRKLVPGNRVEPLVDGDVAYPAMIEAIDAAKTSIALASYIFNHDAAGRRFVDALARAVSRGVEVRVLVDAVGARYSYPSILRALRHAKIPSARFMPTLLPWRMVYLNLRNHRKLLVVDGRIGFAGGINIQQAHVLADHPNGPVQDLHFRIEGPVVAHLQEAFAEDWSFSTGEVLGGATWYPALKPAGDVIARGITDGPDEDFEQMRWAILGALNWAHTSVRIMTPYFLPDPAVATAIEIAAMSGLKVDIVLPEENNQRLVQWACDATLRDFVERGCRVWKTPAPFDHTKIMVVDGVWALIGSANWDARSMRLNFEFNVECYDRAFGGALADLIEKKIKSARQVTLKELDARSPLRKVRDGCARLLSPYL